MGLLAILNNNMKKEKLDNLSREVEILAKDYDTHKGTVIRNLSNIYDLMRAEQELTELRIKHLKESLSAMTWFVIAVGIVDIGLFTFILTL